MTLASKLDDGQDLHAEGSLLLTRRNEFIEHRRVDVCRLAFKNGSSLRILCAAWRCEDTTQICLASRINAASGWVFGSCTMPIKSLRSSLYLERVEMHITL